MAACTRKTRDRSAIEHHYNLSNDFYSLILDPHMAYSCGYWTSTEPGYTVEDAQRDKLDLVCRKLGIEPGGRHLDIGCGWGSLSLHAAEKFGAQVVGVTISSEQKAFIDARIRERGLEDRVEIRLQDYREVPDGPFDTISSIEMGEHVGQRNYPTFTGQIHRLLRPGGRALIQQMSRTTRPGGGPFIEAFIAPDMHMRPVGETVDLIEQAGLEVRDVHALREHYVWTVNAWYDTFEANWDRVVAMVGEEVGARLAPLPRRRRARLRGGPHGRRPDPRRQADGRRPQRYAARAGLVTTVSSAWTTFAPAALPLPRPPASTAGPSDAPCCSRRSPSSSSSASPSPWRCASASRPSST